MKILHPQVMTLSTSFHDFLDSQPTLIYRTLYTTDWRRTPARVRSQPYSVCPRSLPTVSLLPESRETDDMGD